MPINPGRYPHLGHEPVVEVDADSAAHGWPASCEFFCTLTIRRGAPGHGNDEPDPVP